MIFCAEIKLTPNGKFLYTSERTKSTLSGFEVDPATGKVIYLFNIPTEEMPRGFNVDPSGQFLVASGQKSEKVSLYSINQSTGELALIERVPAGKGANWVTFVKTKWRYDSQNESRLRVAFFNSLELHSYPGRSICLLRRWRKIWEIAYALIVTKWKTSIKSTLEAI